MKASTKRIVACLLALCFMLAFVACDIPTTTPTEKTYAYIAIDINPSVELVIADGRVESIRACNDDAAVLLAGEDIDDLIDEISSELQTLVELFSEKSKELSSLNASIEDKNSARLDAFKDKPRGEHENVADWQREKENEIASSWYEYKKQWNDERKNDLKK